MRRRSGTMESFRKSTSTGLGGSGSTFINTCSEAITNQDNVSERCRRAMVELVLARRDNTVHYVCHWVIYIDLYYHDSDSDTLRFFWVPDHTKLEFEGADIKTCEIDTGASERRLWNGSDSRLSVDFVNILKV